jgi:hypothetical protein
MASDAPHSHPEGMGLDLSKKYGPLPTWGWAALVIGAYLVFRHIQVGRAAATGGGSTDALTTDASIPGDALGSSGAAGSGYAGTGSVTPGGAGLPTPTNQSWAMAAIGGLVGTGKYKATDITTAISDYLTGQALDVHQVAIVNDAMTGYGTPPTPVPVNMPEYSDTATDFYGNQTQTITDIAGNVVSQASKKYVTPQEFAAEQAAGKAPGVYDPTGGFYDPGTPTLIPGSGTVPS